MSDFGKVLRRIIFAVIVFVVFFSAWCGAEYLIQGHCEKSLVDYAIAIIIALSISGKMEKGAEANDRRNEFAEKFADKLIENIKERTEAESGKDGNREQT